MSQPKSQFINDLYLLHGTPLLKYLTLRLKSRAEAEEVAQEAWERMYKLDQPEGLDNAKAFLFQTASNLGVDRLRRRTLELKHAPNEPDALVSVEDTIAAQQTIDAVSSALEELPQACRQAFVLHRKNGFSYSEIAATLNVSVSMVEKYIIQALRHFRSRGLG